jgi:hypothetical protein
VREVAAAGKVQAHDAVVGLEQRRVHRKVRRGPAKGKRSGQCGVVKVSKEAALQRLNT